MPAAITLAPRSSWRRSARLLSACDHAADVLAYLGFLPPRAIGLETARHLIGACLLRYNVNAKGACTQQVPAKSAYAIIDHAELDICIADDSPSSQIGRLNLTAVSFWERGPYVAFMLGISPPTWGDVASALSAFRPLPGSVICLDPLIGGEA